MFPETSPKNQREHRRFPARWSAALVFHGAQVPYPGRTHDMSIGGTAILMEDHVLLPGPVTLFLSIPPLHAHHRTTVVEIECRLVYNVLSSEHGCFRVGLQFRRFARDGEQVLRRALEERFS